MALIGAGGKKRAYKYGKYLLGLQFFMAIFAWGLI